MYFGGNSEPFLSRPTSRARSMILSWPLRVEKSGVPGPDIAVRRHGLGGPLVILEIADELPGRLELYLAVFREPHLDFWQNRADRIGTNLAIGLGGQ